MYRVFTAVIVAVMAVFCMSGSALAVDQNDLSVTPQEGSQLQQSGTAHPGNLSPSGLAMDENWIEIYVPEADGHGAQELWLGHTQEFYIRINTNIELKRIEIPLVIHSADNTRLWEPITGNEVTPLPIPGSSFDLMTTLTVSTGPNWPDTLVFNRIATPVMDSGTYDIYEVQMTPTELGTVTFGEATFEFESNQFDGIRFFYNSTDFVRPTLIAPEITILSPDCNSNGIPDVQDISNETSQDCNLNQIPDECENDCNGNGRPDECDITDLISDDENANGIPDECEGNQTGCRVRVFVPAQNGHAVQEMVVGESEQIFIELTLDRPDVVMAEIPMFVDKVGGGDMWNGLVIEDIEFLPAADQLSAYHIGLINNQDGIATDSLDLVAIGGTGEAAAIGSSNWIQITVVPTSTGLIEFSSHDYQDGEFTRASAFFHSSGYLIPQFEALPITVLAERIGSGCCRDGYTGNTDCDPEARHNLTDITRLIDRVYITKLPLCCESEGNVDGDANGNVNLADITRLIDHVYLSKNPTSICF